MESASVECVAVFVRRQKYGWTGKNFYFIKGNMDSLSVGAAE